MSFNQNSVYSQIWSSSPEKKQSKKNIASMMNSKEMMSFNDLNKINGDCSNDGNLR